MNEKEQTQAFVEEMSKRAVSYAEDKLSLTKSLLSENGYDEIRALFVEAFLSGVNASIKYLAEQKNKQNS